MYMVFGHVSVNALGGRVVQSSVKKTQGEY